MTEENQAGSVSDYRMKRVVDFLVGVFQNDLDLAAMCAEAWNQKTPTCLIPPETYMVLRGLSIMQVQTVMLAALDALPKPSKALFEAYLQDSRGIHPAVNMATGTVYEEIDPATLELPDAEDEREPKYDWKIIRGAGVRSPNHYLVGFPDTGMQKHYCIAQLHKLRNCWAMVLQFDPTGDNRCYLVGAAGAGYQVREAPVTNPMIPTTIFVTRKGRVGNLLTFDPQTLNTSDNTLAAKVALELGKKYDIRMIHGAKDCLCEIDKLPFVKVKAVTIKKKPDGLVAPEPPPPVEEDEPEDDDDEWMEEADDDAGWPVPPHLTDEERLRRHLLARRFGDNHDLLTPEDYRRLIQERQQARLDRRQTRTQTFQAMPAAAREQMEQRIRERNARQAAQQMGEQATPPEEHVNPIPTPPEHPPRNIAELDALLNDQPNHAIGENLPTAARYVRGILETAEQPVDELIYQWRETSYRAGRLLLHALHTISPATYAEVYDRLMAVGMRAGLGPDFRTTTDPNAPDPDYEDVRRDPAELERIGAYQRNRQHHNPGTLLGPTPPQHQPLEGDTPPDNQALEQPN